MWYFLGAVLATQPASDSNLSRKLNITAFPCLLESPGFFGKISRLGKSWKMILILESPGICWDADAMLQMQTWKYFHPDYDGVLENTFGSCKAQAEKSVSYKKGTVNLLSRPYYHTVG